MRKSRAVTAVFGLALVIQACSPSAASPAATTGASTGAATPAASAAAPSAAPSTAAEAVELTLLEHQKPRLDVLAKILPMCEASLAEQGLNVKVNLTGEVTEDEQFRQNVTILYQGDNPPDITSYPGSWVPDFATAGYLLDISDRLAAWPDWEAHFYPVLRERAKQADGKYYSMPRHGTVIELFIRKDVLEQNGISTDQPNSWQELIDRLTALHAKTNLPAITIPAGKTWGGGTFDEGFIHIFNGTGGKLYDDATGKWIVKSQGLTDAFNFYSTLQKGGLLPTQGAARSSAVGAHQVRRLHRERPPTARRSRWHLRSRPRGRGAGCTTGSAADRRPAHPRHLRRQGGHLGVPEQGRGRQLRVVRRGLDVDHLRKVQAPRRGVRAPAVPEHRCAPRDGRRGGRQPRPA